MNIEKKHLKYLPLLLILLIVIITFSVNTPKREIKKVITNELSLLKNLDKDATMKYVSYKELFPSASNDDDLTVEAEEAFSLFFKNFNFKVLEINMDDSKKNAQAIVRLETTDSRALAEDFTAAFLKEEIDLLANNSSENTSSSFSLKDRYILLNQLLSENEYDTVESNCIISLSKNKDKMWEIKQDYSLENDLVGNLITYLSDPDILSPEKTLSVYLDCLNEMNETDMLTFLGLDGFLENSDQTIKEIAAALADQVHKNFNYKIITASTSGYRSTVDTEITTFDSEAILEAFQKKLDKYLASADAVIDGSSKRYERSCEILVDCIKENKDTITSVTEFHLFNNSSCWIFENGSHELGEAILGTLTTSPIEEEK